MSRQSGDALIQEREHEIEILRQRCASLSQQLQASLQKQQQKQQKPQQRNQDHPLSPHAMNVGSRDRRSIQRERIGRNASIATRKVLDNLAVQPAAPLSNTVQRILDMFQHPTQHMDYLNSEKFANDLLKLTKSVKKILENEPRVVYLQSPCYVFGDIHGNLEDLHFFSDNIWRLGMSLTPGNFVFLGDYVDRGMNCLETVAFLLSMKQQLPQKVFLLRGNHETRDVNGWEEHYAERSYIWQCRNRFGDDLGYRVWEACNSVFDRLPLAAVIDQDIFCVHGGIPRPVSSITTRIQDILSVSKVAGINPPYEHEDDRYQQVASDCIWSDPASEEQEMSSVNPDTGYGESLRGGGAICFGNKAVSDFLAEQDFSYIMRAHEAHADGVAISKEARVFTVFSTSQDHNQGAHAMAGCMLVDNEKLQVINRSPAYRNQYVHRRDSVSLSSLSESEIQKRVKLGLVTSAVSGVVSHTTETDDSEWDDIVEDEKGEDDSSYVFATNRRSSVDMVTMTNSHDTEIDSSAGMTYTSINYETSRRQRSSNPMVASISEEINTLDDDEVATVDGDEMDADGIV